MQGVEERDSSLAVTHSQSCGKALLVAFSEARNPVKSSWAAQNVLKREQ